MTTIRVKGMRCEGCAKSVTRRLETTEGVRDVTVNLATGEITYTSQGAATCDLVRHQIEDLGYQVDSAD